MCSTNYLVSEMISNFVHPCNFCISVRKKYHCQCKGISPEAFRILFSFDLFWVVSWISNRTLNGVKSTQLLCICNNKKPSASPEEVHCWSPCLRSPPKYTWANLIELQEYWRSDNCGPVSSQLGLISKLHLPMLRAAEFFKKSLYPVWNVWFSSVHYSVMKGFSRQLQILCNWCGMLIKTGRHYVFCCFNYPFGLQGCPLNVFNEDCKSTEQWITSYIVTLLMPNGTVIPSCCTALRFWQQLSSSEMQNSSP